jgi:PAS domain S-box-containing protein
MGEEKSNFDKSKNLRKLALEKLGKKALNLQGEMDVQNPDEMRRLLHELRVHQIELEMQNEELRRAQLELEASRMQYFDLYELAPVGYVTLDERGLIRNANLTAAQLLDIEKGKLLREPLTRFIVREDQDIYYLFCKQLWNEHKQDACELRMLKKSGSWFWALLEVTVTDHKNILPTYRVVIMDITRRKQAEEMLKEAQLQLEQKVRDRTLELEQTNSRLQLEIKQHTRLQRALQKSEEHFRKIVELMPLAIFGQTQKGIFFANTAASAFLGITKPRELVGKNLTMFVDPDKQEMFSQQLDEVLTDKVEKKCLTEKFISTIGKELEAELFLTPYTYLDSPAVYIIAYDLTQRKKIEQEIQKADKLESLGILAGGIAHDFNNYLATLLGNISLAKLYKDNSEKIIGKMENMEKATIRAKELSNQLFAFARGAEPVKKKVSLNGLLLENINFTLSGSKVRCDLIIDEYLHMVEIDVGQFSQVLNNIIINAVQAMPGGGAIKVCAGNFRIEAGDQNSYVPLPAGDYVKISIKDEGTGIPEEHLQKIFDPFFTTKQKGSGLGLSISYSIISNHKGHLSVETGVDAGTTFIIYLPAALQDGLEIAEEDSLIYGSGKILVMDDEADIRESVGRMLCYLGYEVCFAADGSEAIEMYLEANKTTPFDLIVMDLTVKGGMGGKDAISELMTIDPEVKAIISSGYSDDPVMSNYQVYGFKGVVKKPYTIEELSKVIHKTIGVSGG